MDDEPLWPDVEEIIAPNRLIVAEANEPHNLLNPSGLESACARPHNLWAHDGEDRLAYLGAALIAAIGWNHPFQRGHKRNALIAALVSFENNGYLDHPDTDDFGPMVQNVYLPRA